MKDKFACGTGVSPARAACICGRGAHATGRAITRTLIPMLLLTILGCQDPGYRTEVTGNGQGGVEIHRVPKDPSETAAQPVHESQLEQRIEVLEATVLRQQQEIATLQRELSTKNSTTTAP